MTTTIGSDCVAAPAPPAHRAAQQRGRRVRPGEGGFSEKHLALEHRPIEQVHLLGGFLDTFTVPYPQLQDIDVRRTATEFEVPMFFVQGAHEAGGRAELFDEWYPMVDAPTKDLVVLDTSGHRPLFEQPHEFVDVMVGTVLARSAEEPS